MFHCKHAGTFPYLFIFAFILLMAGYALASTIYQEKELADYSSTCLDCHEDYLKTLKDSPHSFSPEEMNSRFPIGCISCHDGWKEHLEDPGVETISNVMEEPLGRQEDICARCHVTLHQTSMAGDDPHARVDITCTECHTVHNNLNRFLLKSDRDNYCLECHRAVGAEFNSNSFHPLETGNVRCIDCHKLGRIEDYLTRIGNDWRCQNCHSELSGPFVYEHKVVYSHYVEGNGCIECHEPHGSANRSLLKQPGDGLCYQCHTIPPGHITNHSGFPARTPCVSCHSEVHGSNDSRLFLAPDLNMRFASDCYQSGCHTRGN
jgi:DmsE family decaheme c-type cytochrome